MRINMKVIACVLLSCCIGCQLGESASNNIYSSFKAVENSPFVSGIDSLQVNSPRLDAKSTFASKSRKPDTEFRQIERGRLKELDSFYKKLEQFSGDKKGASPRIYWLGDSHTAADFMTHRVRRRLFHVAGEGGPGFVRVGSDHYRHEEVQFHRSGQWSSEPAQPARRSRVFDGVFGYGGVRYIPRKGADASVRWRDQNSRKSEPRDVVIQLRLADSARVSVSFAQQIFELSEEFLKDFTERRVLLPQQPAQPLKSSEVKPVELKSVEQVGPISWVRFSLQHAARMQVRSLQGRPEIFGAFIEYAEPGAVLDTAGINGARIATVLAWQADQHIAQIRKRAPDLVVLSYGTNEVFDQTPLSRYPQQYESVLERIRKAVPGISCWMIGPTDAAKANGESRSRVRAITLMQRETARKLHCAFSSPSELMGGEGAFKRWMQAKPRLASSDKVHLTVAGYHKLGELLADEILPLGSKD